MWCISLGRGVQEDVDKSGVTGQGALEYYKQNLMGDSSGSVEDMQPVGAWLMWFERGVRTGVASRLLCCILAKTWLCLFSCL